ncbi:hypothetical protein CLOBOL_04902 [Enterocloster bolteae ATCC BAA-613]|uniref:Uncharacterized protein n=1 Tax=Enterocloster bolteae (strain ATCC BAA-613 / DSM 15670 / CCUG 46953 / JCM 12243 / WAL 16351) TaxID=411902 RepID=A8RXN2_ENTBW|nr:hypothetical protein CLOBOL_04902 [Enterocloster bolteae ATCC BAA-613]
MVRTRSKHEFTGGFAPEKLHSENGFGCVQGRLAVI